MKLETPEVGDAYCFVAIDARVSSSWRGISASATSAARRPSSLTSSARRAAGFNSARTASSATRRPSNWCSQSGPLTTARSSRSTPRRKTITGTRPAKWSARSRVSCCGDPDPDKICTSHVERHNLSMRMQNRRLTRLTNAFSKKWSNHDAALGLYFAVYNFVRPHGTLTHNDEQRREDDARHEGRADGSPVDTA